MSDRENSTTVVTSADEIAAVESVSFRAGYEVGRADAIDRCLIEKLPIGGGDYRTHNVAVNLCVVAIRALDVRHALLRWRSA